MSPCQTEPHLAYLVSAYPATSHTFILREVLGLRQLGFQVQTASINPDPRPLSAVTAAERDARAETYVVKSHGLAGALAAQLWALTRHPAGYMTGLVTAVRRSRSLRHLGLQLAHFAEALMVGRWMAGLGLSHLHVHFGTAAASVASLARVSLPIRLSMTLHGPDEFANVREEQVAAKVAIADFIICISHFACSQAMQHSAPEHWHKFSVVRLGVDTRQYTPSISRFGRPFTLLCVGRLCPAKGQYLLLEAVAQLVRRGYPALRLHVVGDGPDATALRTRCRALGLEGAVYFEGARNQTEVRALYDRADAFVLPSFAEGIPVVLMEAMACGLPCISTRVAGIPELIEDGRNGLLVSPSDVDQLATQIARLMNDAGLRRRLGDGARTTICRDYELVRNVARLADVFRTHLQGVTPCLS